MRDNHLHTYFSYDSTAAFEDYLKVSDGEIITTEHFDMSNPETSRDDVPDYDNYSRTIDDFQDYFPFHSIIPPEAPFCGMATIFSPSVVTGLKERTLYRSFSTP